MYSKWPVYIVLNYSVLKNMLKNDTPRPRAALLVCLKKHSAIRNSAIGNYVVLYSKLIQKTVLLEVSFGKDE